MAEQRSEAVDREKKLVLWGYLLQWGSLVMPFAIIGSLIYVLVLRSRLTQPWLRTHFAWQLSTCIIIAAAIPVGLGLLAVGFSGVATDAPVSIVATFLLVGVSFLFPFWFIYRCLRGTMNYSGGRPMGNPWL